VLRCWVGLLLLLLQGPREDSGFSSGVDPGVRLASQLYTYIKKFHPKTQVMASGLRTKDGEQAGALPAAAFGWLKCGQCLMRHQP
jgi:hypothetical protein